MRDPAFQAVPELVKALEQLAEPKFGKIMAYLKTPVSRRVRTNNHVERANRMLRFLEKVRYQWRRRMTMGRFWVLKLYDVWCHWSPPEAKAETTPQPKAVEPRKPPRNDGLQPRRVA